jgi:hypothetical protein
MADRRVKLVTSKQIKEPILQLKITLLESEPEIWRRVQVPERLTLAKLHDIIQIVMGWRNSHLHEFEIGGKRYSDPSFELDETAFEEEDIEPVGNEKKFKLSELEKVRSVEKLEYRYDFGDGWQHEIRIEKRIPAEPEMIYPVCIGGERACPPEDCGGIGGYANILSQLANPKDPEHRSTKQWLGGFFDPAAFDPNHLNREHLWAKRW